VVRIGKKAEWDVGSGLAKHHSYGAPRAIASVSGKMKKNKFLGGE
jgi:hypothetical protein